MSTPTGMIVVLQGTRLRDGDQGTFNVWVERVDGKSGGQPCQAYKIGQLKELRILVENGERLVLEPMIKDTIVYDADNRANVRK
jgi:hypothetical protein